MLVQRFSACNNEIQQLVQQSLLQGPWRVHASSCSHFWEKNIFFPTFVKLRESAEYIFFAANKIPCQIIVPHYILHKLTDFQKPAARIAVLVKG
jgi:hypothetical protein